jgi:methylated-DNA-[protein]-cysteine S-methyltransferase
MFYRVYPTPFGTAVIVWDEDIGLPLVRHVKLSKPGFPADKIVPALLRNKGLATCPAIDNIAAQITAFLEGENISFPLDCIRLDLCSPFQQKVLHAEHAIPRGRVSSYSRIAAHIGHAGAGRAVGTALATNPFPVIIPCHRAIRSDGSPGDYQGGVDMKRNLLEMEGIKFDKGGRVGMEYFIY